MKRHLLKNALFVYEMWPLFVFKGKGNESLWKTQTKFLSFQQFISSHLLGKI